jgi:hypothetical protein
MVPALVVPGWGHALQGECEEQEQGVLDPGGTLESWCMVPAMVVPGWGHATQGECEEQEQGVLDPGGAL